ncbi:MAG: hypothetical protein EOP33_02670 [Rickettsiaceae bacterium]|nr:MAG: hypothetical protein EOP33_02670 [Rickettsiaceae bacterium]
MKTKSVFSIIAIIALVFIGILINKNKSNTEMTQDEKNEKLSKEFKVLSSPILPNEKLLKEVTVLTSSYDGYSELWKPHYELLFRNWPALKENYSFIPILLLTNELKYEDSRVVSLEVGKDTTWSRNLLKALDSVTTKYTFLLFDDYIMNGPVDNDRFIELLTLMEETDGAYLEAPLDEGQFIDGNEKNRKLVPGIKGVIYRTIGSGCRNSLQASIWNTEELRKLIDPRESAWDFEIIGNARTQDNPKPFYMVIDKPMLTYLNATVKRTYEKEVVDYINSVGIEFHPEKFSIKTREEIADYVKTEEAIKLIRPYWVEEKQPKEEELKKGEQSK